MQSWLFSPSQTSDPTLFYLGMITTTIKAQLISYITDVISKAVTSHFYACAILSNSKGFSNCAFRVSDFDNLLILPLNHSCTHLLPVMNNTALLPRLLPPTPRGYLTEPNAVSLHIPPNFTFIWFICYS